MADARTWAQSWGHDLAIHPRPGSDMASGPPGTPLGHDPVEASKARVLPHGIPPSMGRIPSRDPSVHGQDPLTGSLRPWAGSAHGIPPSMGASPQGMTQQTIQGPAQAMASRPPGTPSGHDPVEASKARVLPHGIPPSTGMIPSRDPSVHGQDPLTGSLLPWEHRLKA